MILIIGGAYQGKLEYAKNRFHFHESDIFICTDLNVDYSKKCVYSLEEYVWSCVKMDIDPLDDIQEHQEQWKDSGLICQDIFCGVVPVSEEHRKWRLQTGRLCQYLAKEADEVVRIFCGLEQRIK